MGDTAKESGVWPWPDSLDGVVAASGSHRVVLENELTRVLEVTIAPGEREPEHTHRWPSVMVVHRPARIRYYSGDTVTFTSPSSRHQAHWVRGSVGLIPRGRIRWRTLMAIPMGPSVSSSSSVDRRTRAPRRLRLPWPRPRAYWSLSGSARNGRPDLASYYASDCCSSVDAFERRCWALPPDARRPTT